MVWKYITVKYVEELIDINEPLEFNSRIDFINSIYEASNHDYIPIGFVGVNEKADIIDQAKNVVGNVIGSVVNITKKTISSITDMSAALNIDEMGAEEVQLDINSRIMVISKCSWNPSGSRGSRDRRSPSR